MATQKFSFTLPVNGNLGTFVPHLINNGLPAKYWNSTVNISGATFLTVDSDDVPPNVVSMIGQSLTDYNADDPAYQPFLGFMGDTEIKPVEPEDD